MGSGGIETRGEEVEDLELESGVVAEAGEPGDIGFAPEPRELPLCVTASGLLDFGFRGVERKFVAKDGAKLAIADEIETFGIGRDTGSE